MEDEKQQGRDDQESREERDKRRERVQAAARRSLENLNRRSDSSAPKTKALRNMKTLADQMLDLSEHLGSSALYINKLLEVLLLSPAEYSELSRAGVVDEPLPIKARPERSSSPNIAQLLQLAQGADLEALAQQLLSRIDEEE